MRKMLRKFVRRYPLAEMLEIMESECKEMAEEMAEGGIKRDMKDEGFARSEKRYAEARALKKCINDIHRQNTCPFWVGGRNKSWI
jgi:hypothetical protein